MFVCLNNGGTLSIIGVVMKAIDDSKIRSAPLVTGLSTAILSIHHLHLNA